MNKDKLIRDEFEKYLESDMTKVEIYTKVVENLHVPRPTVRRVARGLIEFYRKRVEKLTMRTSKKTVKTNTNTGSD